jgi:hypothetical protein
METHSFKSRLIEKHWAEELLNSPLLASTRSRKRPLVATPYLSAQRSHTRYKRIRKSGDKQVRFEAMKGAISDGR